MKISKRQRELLELIKSEGGEIAWERGGGWWIGDHRTNGKFAVFLIKNMLIKEDQMSRDDFKYFELSESAERLLAGEDKIFCDANGVYHETVDALIFSDRDLRTDYTSAEISECPS